MHVDVDCKREIWAQNRVLSIIKVEALDMCEIVWIDCVKRREKSTENKTPENWHLIGEWRKKKNKKYREGRIRMQKKKHEIAQQRVANSGNNTEILKNTS